MGALVFLGNHQAVDHVRTGEVDGRGEHVLSRVPLPGKRCTRVELPDGIPTADAITTLTHPGGVWAAHSDADAPAWVASTDPALAQVLSAFWGGVEVREPEGV